MEELYKKSDRIVISTNGYFTDRIIELCKKFPKLGIRISIEGMQATNDAIRRLPDGWTRGYETLKTLVEMGHPDVGFGMTVQDMNCEDLVPLYKLSDEMGMEFATATLHNSFYFRKTDNKIDDKYHVAQNFEALINELLQSKSPKKWFRAYFNHGLINYIYGNPRLLPCDMSRNAFFIDPFCDVIPCNGMAQKAVMGNLKESPDWETLWTSEQAEKVREADPQVRPELLDDRQRIPRHAQVYLGARLVGGEAQVLKGRQVQPEGKQLYHAPRQERINGKSPNKRRNTMAQPKDSDFLKIAMIGHKRVPGREGGVEVVVEELSARMAARGHDVTLYNRASKDVAPLKEYEGCRIVTVPTVNKKSLDALIYSFLAALRSLFGGYDVYHFHALGPSVMLLLPRLLGKRTVATVHGLDWQRAKWGGFGTKYLKLGEKIIARHASEVIVLSKGVQEYFREEYGRETKLIPNGVVLPTQRPAEIIQEEYGLEKGKYILFLARIVPEKGLHYLLDAYKEIKTDVKLVIAGGDSHSGGYYGEMVEKAKEDPRVVLTGFVQGEKKDEAVLQLRFVCAAQRH